MAPGLPLTSPSAMLLLVRVRSVAVLACLLAIFAIRSASAHNPEQFYSWSKWDRTGDHHTGLHITWRFAPNFPDGGPMMVPH
jgi:hypothetical protein